MIQHFLHHIPSPVKAFDYRYPFHRLRIMLIFDLFIIACPLLPPIILSQIYFLLVLHFININFYSHALHLLIVHISFIYYYCSSSIFFIPSTTRCCMQLFFVTSKTQKSTTTTISLHVATSTFNSEGSLQWCHF